MKKFRILITLCLTVLTLTVGISAEENLFVLDWSDLLTAEEESALNAFLGGISDEADANIIVATVDSLEGDSAQNFADNLYDAGLSYFGLMDGTEDGALLLVAMNERQWAISTAGYGIEVITDQALDHMEDAVIPYLSEGAYYLAFQTFGELCSAYWDADPYGYENGDPLSGSTYPVYDDSLYGEDIYYPSGGETIRYGSAFGPQWIFIALLIGFLIALIPMGVLKSQLSSVHMQSGAVTYRKQDTVRITDSRDLFLYRNITKKPIPRDDPNRSGGSMGSRPGGGFHTSSSGRSHGGRSGGF